MKIITYNVNGIRAAAKKGFFQWMEAANPDVVLIQETKAMKEQVQTDILTHLGYHHYWHSAEKKGYSGVSVFSKEEPKNINIGCEIDYIDREGRILQIDFENISIMSVYVPSGTNLDRLEYKFQFMDDFYDYVQKLLSEKRNLVIGGDFNICHEAIDIHDPVRNKTVSGFLPEERAWLDKFMKNLNFTDSFRHLHPEPHQYSWWSYRANARNNNKGWRIDYLMLSNDLQGKLNRAYMLPEAKHSDHCPVVVELDL